MGSAREGLWHLFAEGTDFTHCWRMPGLLPFRKCRGFFTLVAFLPPRPAGRYSFACLCSVGTYYLPGGTPALHLGRIRLRRCRRVCSTSPSAALGLWVSHLPALCWTRWNWGGRSADTLPKPGSGRRRHYRLRFACVAAYTGWTGVPVLLPRALLLVTYTGSAAVLPDGSCAFYGAFSLPYAALFTVLISPPLLADAHRSAVAASPLVNGGHWWAGPGSHGVNRGALGCDVDVPPAYAFYGWVADACWRQHQRRTVCIFLPVTPALLRCLLPSLCTGGFALHFAGSAVRCRAPAAYGLLLHAPVGRRTWRATPTGAYSGPPPLPRAASTGGATVNRAKKVSGFAARLLPFQPHSISLCCSASPRLPRLLPATAHLDSVADGIALTPGRGMGGRVGWIAGRLVCWLDVRLSGIQCLRRNAPYAETTNAYRRRCLRSKRSRVTGYATALFCPSRYEPALPATPPFRSLLLRHTTHSLATCHYTFSRPVFATLPGFATSTTASLLPHLARVCRISYSDGVDSGLRACGLRRRGAVFSSSPLNWAAARGLLQRTGGCVAA